MSNSPVCPVASRTSALQVWLRLTLAAFVIAVYAVIGMAGGVARADDGPSASGGETGTKGATSQQSEPQKSGTDAATSHQAPASGAEKPAKADPPKADDSNGPYRRHVDHHPKDEDPEAHGNRRTHCLDGA